MKIKGWLCQNCGHVHPAGEDLEELGFAWYGDLTSRVRCANCGSYTVQRAFDDTFTAGYFLIVRSFNTITKGGRNHGTGRR